MCLVDWLDSDDCYDTESNFVPAKYVDAICVVLEGRQLSPEHLQSLQDFTILQIF